MAETDRETDRANESGSAQTQRAAAESHSRLEMSQIDLASVIDHALLHPLAGPAEIAQWCGEADRYGFAAVVVLPANVKAVAEELHRKRPQVTAAIAFPTGASTARGKLYEACGAIEDGAQALAVGLNLAWLVQGRTEAVHRELAEICEAAEGRPVTAILELGLLPEAQWQTAVEIALDAGAAGVQTHTGWYGGVTIAQVRALKNLTHGRGILVAAGGIATVEQAIGLIEAGATRLATSRAVEWLARRR